MTPPKRSHHKKTAGSAPVRLTAIPGVADPPDLARLQRLKAAWLEGLKARGIPLATVTEPPKPETTPMDLSVVEDPE